MKIRLNKSTGRLEIRTRKRMVFFSFDILRGVYYLIPTIRIDDSGSLGVGKSVWFFFLGVFVLIDIFKTED